MRLAAKDMATLVVQRVETVSASKANVAFVQNYSVPKVVGMEILLLIGAVLPMTPNFGAHAHYTSFMYSWPFFLVLILSCLCLGYLSVLMISVIWRAFLRLPAVEISSDEIVVHSNRKKRAELSKIVSATSSFGNVVLKLGDGKKFVIPVWLCENPSTTLRRLRAVLPSSVKHGMELSS